MSDLEKLYYVKKETDEILCKTKINSALIEISKDYDNLTDENKESLRCYISSLFEKLRYSKYDMDKLNELINNNLYPKIKFIELSKLYSEDLFLQVEFIEKINSELHYILSNNRKEK